MSIIEQLFKNRNKVGYQLYQLLFIKQPYIYGWSYDKDQFIPKKKFCDKKRMRDFFIRQLYEYDDAIDALYNFYEGNPKDKSAVNHTFVFNDQILYYDRKIRQWMRV